MQYLTTLILFFIIQTTANSALPDNFTASYDLYHNEMYIGEARRSLTREKNLLTLSSIAESKGIAAWFFDVKINEESKLQFKDKHLNFLSYSYNEKSSDEVKNYQLKLDKQQVYNSHTQKFTPLVSNLYDTLGISIAVMHDMQAGRRELKYTVAEKSKVKKYSLKLIKEEKLPTSTGEITTLKLEHYNPTTGQRFTLWCAESMGFLPIRILKINHKGDEKLLNLTKFNQKTVNLELEEQDID